MSGLGACRDLRPCPVPHQGDESDLEFPRQLSEAACSKDRVVMGEFNFPDVCWDKQAARSAHSQKFLTSLQDLTYCRRYAFPLGK